MNPSPVLSSNLIEASARIPEERIPEARGAVSTRVYEGVTLVAMLLLLGSLWVF